MLVLDSRHYARTSTTDQQAGLDAQLRDLKAAGCRKVFSEQASAVGQRLQLDAAFDYCRDGDTNTTIPARLWTQVTLQAPGGKPAVTVTGFARPLALRVRVGPVLSSCLERKLIPDLVTGAAALADGSFLTGRITARTLM